MNHCGSAVRFCHFLLVNCAGGSGLGQGVQGRRILAMYYGRARV
jgi:hypothetical protein